MLYGQNNSVVKLPRLKGLSNVSVFGNVIIVDDDPKYSITIENGKIRLIGIEDVEHDDITDETHMADVLPKRSIHVSEKFQQTENNDNLIEKVIEKETDNQTTQTVLSTLDEKAVQTIPIHEESSTASYTMLPVFKKKMEKESFQELWGQILSSVDITKKYIPERHRMVVKLSGPMRKVEKAKAMLENINHCKEISFKEVGHIETFKNIVDVLNEFFRLLLTDKEAFFDINEDKEVIGICTYSQRITDDITGAIRTCIHRTEIERQDGDPSFTSHLIEEMDRDLDHRFKPYIRMQLVDENSIIVYGLHKYLQLCIDDVKQSVKSSLGRSSEVYDHPTKETEIVEENVTVENPLVFDCICKPSNLGVIQKCQVFEIKPPVFVIKGPKEDVDIAKSDIEALENSIEVHNFDFVIQGGHNAFDRGIHQLENTSNIIVKRQENRDKTILYEQRKVQWVLSHGHTVEIAKTCLTTGNKCLVRFEENNPKVNHGVSIKGNNIVVFVPKWKDGNSKETVLLSEGFDVCLQECIKRSIHHIDVIIGRLSWKMQKFVKQLLLLLNNVLRNTSPSLNICFCGNDQTTCIDIYDSCKAFFKGVPQTKEGVLMTVVGTQHDVATVVETLRKMNGVVLIEVCSPKHFTILKLETGTYKQTDGAEQVTGPCGTVQLRSNYVEVRNIPRGLVTPALKEKIFKEGVFPVGTPKLIYSGGSDIALLICQSEQDAVQLSQCTSIEQFEFRAVERKALSKITKTIDQDVVKKMKQAGNYDMFKEELQFADIDIKGETPFVLVAPTIFQLTYAKCVIEKHAQIELTPSLQVQIKTGYKKAILCDTASVGSIGGLQNEPENDMNSKQRKMTGPGRGDGVSESQRVAITKTEIDWPGGARNIQNYITKENMNIYVYKANILQLNVDCITSASNQNLQHGGGVAAVIARAAGYKLNDESFDYIRTYGTLPVGHACTTTAGNLNYDCVIHAVGPRWSDYYPHSFKDVQQCKLHLYQAVYNSFMEAEKRGLKSIALPALSSAIFGVPEEICVYQYAKAIMEYSRRSKGHKSTLTEIHFIDKNENIVKKIQDAFHNEFVKGDTSQYDSKSFVKTKKS